MSKRAREALGPLLGEVCEVLPIEDNSVNLYSIIHVMETIDCLDTTRSEFTRNKTTSRINHIYKYAIRLEMVEGKHIFKLPAESGGNLLVDDAFREVVESNGLSGLLFKPLGKA